MPFFGPQGYENPIPCLPVTLRQFVAPAKRDPVYVKEQMEQSSIAIGVELYGHLIPGGNRQTVDRLDEPVMRRWDGVGSATPAQPGGTSAWRIPLTR